MHIRPIVIYPFRHPQDTVDLNALYLSLDDAVRAGQGRYVRPLTVINRQTYYRNTQSPQFQDLYHMVQSLSDVVDAWCVDTCQMWLTGLGASYDAASQRPDENDNDVFWLIPGDFDYSSRKGVLDKLYDIPSHMSSAEADLCVGQLELHSNSAKHLIDTYGTYGLLFNWFPAEAAEMRANGILRPRSEFLAIHHRFLHSALVEHRWFAYEQTIALLLQASGRRIATVPLGGIVDPDVSRDTLTGALQQIERTERVLKVAWRDRKIRNRRADWVKEFRILEAQSAQIIGAAMTVLENSL